MKQSEIQVVTGGLGYSGRYIVQRLLSGGARVRTITNSPHRPSPFGDRLEIRPLSFGDPDALARSLEGAAVLYNTYWVRFNHTRFRHATAVENTVRLFEAARRGGVRRIVHVSITNPSLDSPLEYFRGKAVLEQALRGSGIPHAILRPTVLFGREDILINNIAWLLRRFPVFGVFGDGSYRLQPIFVDDLASLAVAAGARSGNTVVNAIGPETFTFRELVATLGRLIGRERRLVSIPPAVGLLAGRVIGALVRDVLITREEIEGLMADLLHVDDVPAGTTKLTDWAREHADELGRRYASELGRRNTEAPQMANR
jgi:NADH dehydrogenase